MKYKYLYCDECGDEDLETNIKLVPNPYLSIEEDGYVQLIYLCKKCIKKVENEKSVN